MLGNSLNIVDTIRGYLTGDVVNKMSSFMGESTERTRTGLTSAVPHFLNGLDRAASTPDGIRHTSIPQSITPTKEY